MNIIIIMLCFIASVQFFIAAIDSRGDKRTTTALTLKGIIFGLGAVSVYDISDDVTWIVDAAFCAVMFVFIITNQARVTINGLRNSGRDQC